MHAIIIFWTWDKIYSASSIFMSPFETPVTYWIVWKLIRLSVDMWCILHWQRKIIEVFPKIRNSVSSTSFESSEDLLKTWSSIFLIASVKGIVTVLHMQKTDASCGSWCGSIPPGSKVVCSKPRLKFCIATSPFSEILLSGTLNSWQTIHKSYYRLMFFPFHKEYRLKPNTEV